MSIQRLSAEIHSLAFTLELLALLLAVQLLVEAV